MQPCLIQSLSHPGFEAQPLKALFPLSGFVQLLSAAVGIFFQVFLP